MARQGGDGKGGKPRRLRLWKTLRRRTLLRCGKFLTVEEHTIRLPDGRIIRNWPWVITPNFVNVVAVTRGGRFLCFRQTKYAVRGETLAPVGGYIDAGEHPLRAARRELLEETGYSARRWTRLGAFPVAANRGVARGYFYLAQDARRVAAPRADDLEEQELLRLSRQELERQIDAGAFKTLAWTAALVLALRRLDAPRGWRDRAARRGRRGRSPSRRVE